MIYICPVCNGRTIQRADFYNVHNKKKIDPTPVTCRSCNGKGYISDFIQAPAPYIPNTGTWPPNWFDGTQIWCNIDNTDKNFVFTLV